MREGGRKRRWVHVLVEGNERGIKGGIKRGTRICALRRKRESYGEIRNKKEKGNRIFIILFYFREHCNWVDAYCGMFKELQEYVKMHHTTGLKWNPDVSITTPTLITNHTLC